MNVLTTTERRRNTRMTIRCRRVKLYTHAKGTLQALLENIVSCLLPAVFQGYKQEFLSSQHRKANCEGV